jgi:hypothetical protein
MLAQQSSGAELAGDVVGACGDLIPVHGGLPVRLGERTGIGAPRLRVVHAGDEIAGVGRPHLPRLLQQLPGRLELPIGQRLARQFQARRRIESGARQCGAGGRTGIGWLVGVGRRRRRRTARRAEALDQAAVPGACGRAGDDQRGQPGHQHPAPWRPGLGARFDGRGGRESLQLDPPRLLQPRVLFRGAAAARLAGEPFVSALGSGAAAPEPSSGRLMCRVLPSLSRPTATVRRYTTAGWLAIGSTISGPTRVTTSSPSCSMVAGVCQTSVVCGRVALPGRVRCPGCA